MRLWALFLIAAFVLAGTRLGAQARYRPVLLLLGTTAVATLFYSFRFVR
jgi:hypothetical protein